MYVGGLGRKDVCRKLGKEGCLEEAGEGRMSGGSWGKNDVYRKLGEGMMYVGGWGKEGCM